MSTSRFSASLALFLAGSALHAAGEAAPASWTTPCNVTWTTQSKNSSESMPCGGHDIGLNVWVENGDILFYIYRSGSFDENNQMNKVEAADAFGGVTELENAKNADTGESKVAPDKIGIVEIEFYENPGP